MIWFGVVVAWFGCGIWGLRIAVKDFARRGYKFIEDEDGLFFPLALVVVGPIGLAACLAARDSQRDPSESDGAVRRLVKRVGGQR